MSDQSYPNDNEWSRQAWNTNADFWDQRMGEGNFMVRVLEWPPSERLLDLHPGEMVLDVACGNGLTSRRMADLGARVLGIDFAAEMLRHARQRSVDYGDRIEYRPVDATDEAALLALGEGRFDAALCNMALFDMAEIRPLFCALVRLLRPGGRFVFTMMHPAFNNPDSIKFAEEEMLPDRMKTTYGLKLVSYMTSKTFGGLALRDQPATQPYFHRPLQDLLGPAFEAGFVLDGLVESAYPSDEMPAANPLSWSGHFSEFPPVLVMRLRRSG